MGDGRQRAIGTALGLATAAVGIGLTVRPFRSLSVLVVLVAVAAATMGVARIVSAAESPSPLASRLLGAGWIVVATLAVALPDRTIETIGVLVAISLLVSGVVEVVEGIRGTTDQRIAAAIGGVASIGFGALALAWPDVTILVIAVVFGIRTTLFGLTLAWRSFRGRELVADEPDAPRRGVRRFAHSIGAIAALVVALVLGSVSAKLREGEPVVDAFYDAPSDVPAEPGALLRSEAFTRGVPDGARAWRILYTTTRGEGRPAVASAIVVVPGDASGDVPVIAWAHGTTGFDRTCAPSVLGEPFESGAFFALDDALSKGWAVVATDYVGLGTEGPHPYLIGEGEGRSVLDAVRASGTLDDAGLGDQTAIWGHSQGGHAALWAAQLADTYAPDLDVVGVAALAPAANLPGLVENLPEVTGGSIFASYVLNAYAAEYDDIALQDYVEPGAVKTVEEIGGRCLAEPSVLASAAESLATGFSVFRDELGSGQLAERLAANVPEGPIGFPVLLGQGEADSLVVPAAQEAYVEARCAAGQPIDYRTYPGRDHVPLVEPDSPLIPELLAWTADRFDGKAAVPTCGG